MAAEIRVAINVGSQSHQVAVGNAGGELIDEFRVDHRAESFARFFGRIAIAPDPIAHVFLFYGFSDRGQR